MAPAISQIFPVKVTLMLVKGSAPNALEREWYQVSFMQMRMCKNQELTPRLFAKTPLRIA